MPKTFDNLWKEIIYEASKDADGKEQLQDLMEYFMQIEPKKYKQVILVRTDLKLSTGKLAAQVAHAAVSAYRFTNRVDHKAVVQWDAQGQTKIVLAVPDEQVLDDLCVELGKYKIHHHRIIDSGKTEIAEGTLTCVGVGPIAADEIDHVTGKLPKV